MTDDRLLGAPAVSAASSPDRAPRTRLVGWTILVTILAALSYAANLAGGDTPDDVLYQWSTAIGGVVQYAIILAVVLAARAGDRAAGARASAPRVVGARRGVDRWQGSSRSG